MHKEVIRTMVKVASHVGAWIETSNTHDKEDVKTSGLLL